MDDSVKWIGKSWIKAHTTKLKLKYRGSPPRVWGKRGMTITNGYCTRITPTCVGKTIEGEEIFTDELGSPPRVWGKLTDQHD